MVWSLPCKCLVKSFDELLVILKGLTEALLEYRDLGSVRSVVAFGSVARRDDFILCSSDVDLLVIAEGSERRALKYEDLYPISVAIYKPEEFRTLAFRGAPLALHVYRTPLVLYDDGYLKELWKRLRPSITGLTIQYERVSVYGALSLALESHLLEDYDRAVSHAHHALRHAVRATAVAEGMPAEEFPVYDREVEKHLNPFGRRVLEKLRQARSNCGTPEAISLELLEGVTRISGELLKVEMPSPRKVLAECNPPIFLKEYGKTVEVFCRSSEKVGEVH